MPFSEILFSGLLMLWSFWKAMMLYSVLSGAALYLN